MFGSLFEEEGEGYSLAPSGGRVVKGEGEPPPPRGRVNLSGIKNQGGTCYLNSLLQTLLFTPEFREELFSLGPKELGCLEDKDKPEAKVRVIPLELQRLFARLLLVDQQSASTTDLTDSFGWNNSEESRQHDVQELNRILFSALEHSLVDTSGSAFIQRLYHGTTVNSILCKECGNISQRQEDFLDLTVCVRGVCGLEGALWDMFVEEEMFEGSNLYRCGQCDQLVTAAKSAKLRKLPPFLTVSLLRFNFDFARCERYKETGRYTFPLTINLRPFCEQTEDEDSEYSYELFSVIIHKGGCYGGHYHVYIKDMDHLGLWEPPEEDTKPKVQKKKEVRAYTEPEKDDPLSVLSSIIAQEESRSVLLDQLGQRLMDKIGSSWSKKYRKLHGPIGKFLQNHSDVFVLVNNGTWVALKANPPSPVTQPSSPAHPTPGSSSTPDPVHNNTANHLPEPGLETEPKTAPEPQGSHWFDLNDSTVTSIHERDVEKMYQGKESAYMLFYRKTLLRRPSGALRNPGYQVPPHLLEMAEEENRRLQQRRYSRVHTHTHKRRLYFAMFCGYLCVCALCYREEFEASNNSVELRLHLAPRYRLENGALKPISIEQKEATNLTFDRCRTVGDLRMIIYQKQDLWEGDMALTVARSLPAGLHLYNTLTDDEVSLYSAGILSGTDLFVWNGREVCGATVQTGAEWEPVLLTVVRPSLGEEEEEGEGGGVGEEGGSGLTKQSRGFAGRVTLGEVREALGEPQESLLCQEKRGGEGGGASGWRVFPPGDMQRTLKELALKDGDALLVLEPQTQDSSVFSVSGDMVTVTTPSDCRWLLVEYRPERRRRGGGEEEEERMRAKVPASGNMLLCEVKQRAIAELQLQEHLAGVACCLRQVDRTGKLLPPVCEELSVRDAGVRLMTSLSLCPGTAPKDTQLFLYFSVGTAPSSGLEGEIIVERSSTVKQCLKKMLESARLEGDGWHLRRLDWCEDVGEALMDEEASLSELKMSHGDALVITEGRLPPKGFLKLSVWLYVEPSAYSVVSMETEVNGMAAGSTEGQRLEDMTTVGGAMVELRTVGQVEISEEATLEELKTQVLTLPELQYVCVPTPAFLRVWQLEGQRLTRILRGQQHTLRKLKLSSGVEFCVQQLLREEDLGPKEVLLRVQMGVPGERGYYPPEDLVWDASRDPSPRSLRSALASTYGLSPDSLLLAKHQPHTHTWETFSNWSQQVSKRKKKKKAESLLGAPFHLKDGDIIGVKNLLIDNNRDFSTQQDEQRLREEKEQRRKGGQGVGAEVETNRRVGPEKKMGPIKTRKTEVALSINVGVFR
ncbi:ubiquitin carboxyl-terminal hydrolase 40 isoform X2 [Oncorhynchus tshawytscha]|uniref:ubiquitin carboxyl-terminal hydrolase 40 isoform X2 n=1 Tax=Oncorhynchus tshawytscha TaxID=74940 RepID=UPI001C3E60D5|nr:ubiquitin carboxyl-terminal hydrolase 40 isoform X2 [Oncorhynchus tshawytscha]